MLTLKANWNYAVSGEKRHYLVKAFHRNREIGLAHGWYSPDSLFVLQKIEVDRRYRARGFGSSIIEELRRAARGHRCSKFVFSGVRRNNHGAIRLYESMHAVATPGTADPCELVLSPP